MINLPCELGETVYEVFTREQLKPFPFVVNGFEIIKSESEITIWGINQWGDKRVFEGEGKTLYLDEETAKTKLKELQNGKST